jgi:hypothetical protein
LVDVVTSRVGEHRGANVKLKEVKARVDSAEVSLSTGRCHFAVELVAGREDTVT